MFMLRFVNLFLKILKFFKKMPIDITQGLRKYIYRKGQQDMLKKITTPSNNTFSGVEFILREAKKRRTMAISNAVTINAESGVQAKLQAVK